MQHRADSQSAARRAAFTLLELLLVMALIAVFAGLAIPMLSGTRDGQGVRDSAHLVVSQIRRAQALAISEGEPVRLRLDNSTATMAIMVLAADGERLPNDRQDADVSFAENDGRTSFTMNDVSPETSEQSESSAPVVVDLMFLPDGTCYSSGTLTVFRNGSSERVLIPASARPAQRLTSGSESATGNVSAP